MQSWPRLADAWHSNAEIKVYITQAEAEGGNDSTPFHLSRAQGEPETGYGICPRDNA